MAITPCDCDYGLSNSGKPNCTPIENVTYSLIIVPTYDSSGVRNSILLTDTLDSTYFTDRLNAGRSGATLTDRNQRWFPLPKMFSVEDNRADSKFETLDGDVNFFVEKGARTFTSVMPKIPAAYLKKIDGYRCNDISAYIIDIDGKLVGNGETSGYLFPFRLDNETWDTNYMKSNTAPSVQKLSLTFSYDKREFDGDIKLIDSDEMSVDVRNLNGLLDVNATAATSITTTGFVTSLTYDYGTAANALKFKGGLLADFTLYNETTSSSVVISSVTESPDGTYTFVYAAQTSADILSLNLVKDGFEMAELSITTP